MKTSDLRNVSTRVMRKLMPLACVGVLVMFALGFAGCAGTGGAVYASPGYGYVGVAVDDRPYYVHGGSYWRGGGYYVWRPGHWRHHHGHRVWVHGDYVVRR